jgi:beta-lactam-binding protein with PASTA domain
MSDNAENFIAALEGARGQMASGGDGQDTAAFAPIPAPVPVEEPGTGEEELPPWPPDGDLPEEEEKQRRWPWFAIGLVVLALLAVGAWALFLQPEQVKVPDVTGRQQLQAEALLAKASLKPKAEKVRDVATKGTVIRQDPSGGDEVDKSSTVTITVSNGPGEAIVPSVEGLDQKRAVKTLNDQGFKVDLDTEASSKFKQGIAIRTVPGGGEHAPLTQRIRLFISSGPPKVKVPDVVGASQSSAESQLDGQGLVSIVETAESGQPAGNVIAQDPGGGSVVNKGSRVTITVSKGAAQAVVPGVEGFTTSQARQAIGDRGFSTSVREETVNDESNDGIVLRQSPGAGTKLTKGKAVVITVGKFQAPTSTQPSPPGT